MFIFLYLKNFHIQNHKFLFNLFNNVLEELDGLVKQEMHILFIIQLMELKMINLIELYMNKKKHLLNNHKYLNNHQHLY